MSVVVEEVSDPSAAAAWERYVEGREDATCYHLRLWQDVASSAYGMRAPYLLCRDARGAVRGVLPLFVVRFPRRSYVTTGMFGAYGKLLVEDAEACAALVQAAQGVMRRWRARSLIVKAVGEEPLLAAQGFSCQHSSSYATLRLAASADALWRGFRDKIRNAIRKAQRSDLEVRWGRQHLPDYYDVLAENMHRKGTPIYGFSFMRELVTRLGERGEILTLWHQGRAVSAALVVSYKGTVFVPFASSRPAYFRMNPNNLLYWEVMQRACAQGMQVLDFGRSPKGDSTLQFKLNWGAQEQPQPFYVYGRAEMPDTRAPGVQRMISLWQRLPRGLADRLGPAICQRVLI